MIWDFLITIGSLALSAYFLIIEPALKRWREWQATIPKPRNPPITESSTATNQETDMETDMEKFDRLLAELAAIGTDTPPSTSTEQYSAVPAGTPDTKAQNDGYQRVLSLVSQGYSGNQICGMVGGKRADTLALVKRAKAELGR